MKEANITNCTAADRKDTIARLTEAGWTIDAEIPIRSHPGHIRIVAVREVLARDTAPPPAEDPTI